MNESNEDGAKSSSFSGLMESLKDKLQDSTLHDAKVQLIHNKFVAIVLNLIISGFYSANMRLPSRQKIGKLGNLVSVRFQYLIDTLPSLSREVSP